MIAAIGAVSGNGMIGLEGWLPWDIPEELAYFERTVAGSALLIGRLTYESMDVVPPDSFVVTSRTGMKLKPGCRAVDSVEHGLSAALATGKNVFVIGGAALYETAWPYCHFFYLTRIERAFHGDSRLPDSIPFERWTVVGESSETYLERISGEQVVCRFLRYCQNNPEPLPLLDCKNIHV